MKTAVKKDGVLIPKRMLKKGVTAVEIRQEDGYLVVQPIPAPEDPIWTLGSKPVRTDLPDASVEHDRYLYSR